MLQLIIIWFMFFFYLLGLGFNTSTTTNTPIYTFNSTTSTTSIMSVTIDSLLQNLMSLNLTCSTTEWPTTSPTVSQTSNAPTDDPTIDQTTVPTVVTITADPVQLSNVPKDDSSFISLPDDSSQNVILFGALVAALCCLLAFCCVVILIYKKLQNKLAFDLAQIQMAKDQNRIIMSNALIANIVIRKYDDDANGHSLYLEVDSVLDDMKQFANDFGYQYMSMNDKKYWTEQEIIAFLRDDVGSEFFDENGAAKYDGLIVGITSYGDVRDIMSSDGEAMDKVAIHRVISNKYAMIRDFPRIFIFDSCALPNGRKMTVSRGHRDVVMGVISSHVIPQPLTVVATTSESEAQNESDSVSAQEVAKNIDFEDVREVNEWTHDTKNPDYNLVTVDAVGDLSTSNVIHYFAEKVRLNVDNQEGLGLTDVMDHIRMDLRQRKIVSFVPVLNNRTPTMEIQRRQAK